MAQLSIVHGAPLSEEPGLGTLTMPGYLREICQRHATSEALVWHEEGAVKSWTYAELWERSVEVARALNACGVGKDSRVAILMSNRAELLAAAFGTSLAGGLAVMLNTFSTSHELTQLLEASSASVLLFERHVARTDFAELLHGLEPGLRSAEPGRLLSPRFPFLRRCAVIDDSGDSAAEGAVETVVRRSLSARERRRRPS